MKFIKKIGLFLIVIIMITGCDFTASDMENINIYTTIYPINYLLDSLLYLIV